MIQIVQITPRYIAAAFEFQATKDSRYMLNGLLIEREYLVATDGAAMFVANLGTGTIRTHEVETDQIVSLDPKFIAECRKLANRGDDCWAVLSFDFDTDEHYASVHGGARFPFTIVDGQFPAWRAVLDSNKNADRSPQGTAIAARLLLACAKAAKLLSLDNKSTHGVYLAPREFDTTTVRFADSPDTFAVLMPLRQDDYSENTALPYGAKDANLKACA